MTGAQPDGALVLASVGNATHLGRFTKVELLYLNGAEISGSAIFTAANGDQLFAVFEGALGFTTSTNGAEAIEATGAKSRTGS